MRRILSIAALLALIMLSACSQDQTDLLSSPMGGTEKDLTLDTDYTMVEGDFGTGSRYELYLPNEWNGDLVLFAHGYAFPQEEPALPTIDDLRGELMALGYGVGYSSYSQTGWAVQDGMNETRQLRGLFSGAFSHPRKTYLIGKSMGGLIAVALSERNPNLFDGVVPMCAVVGGTKMVMEYIFTVRTLFDYYYPGALPGDVQNIPEGLDIPTAQGLAYIAIMTDPGPAFQIAGITQTNIQYNDPGELINAIITAIVFHVGSYDDFLAENHGHDFFDNADVWYTGSSDDTALNAGIGRYTSSPDAEAYLAHWYRPTGRVKVPTVSIHTTRDPVVQVFHEDRYLDAAMAEGYADNLVQYKIDRFGHCTFTLEEIMAAFNEMVSMDQSSAEGNRLQAR